MIEAISHRTANQGTQWLRESRYCGLLAAATDRKCETDTRRIYLRTVLHAGPNLGLVKKTHIPGDKNRLTLFSTPNFREVALVTLSLID